jgi:hypothetical protein
MTNLYRGPAYDSSYQMSDHLGKRFQRRRFCRNQTIRKKNCLWRPCLLTDPDEMSNLSRGPSQGASYHMLVHLGKWFHRRRFFRNRPMRNKNDMWRPCLLMDWDEMSIRHREPSMHSSYQVWVHWTKRFQETIFRNWPIRKKNCLWRSIFASQGLRFASPFSQPLADLQYILKFARNATWWFIEVAPLR